MTECSVFGKYGRESVTKYTLRHPSGAFAEVITYGATLVNLTTPNKRGVCENIVLSYDTFNDFVRDGFYFGRTVGRYANRIAKGKFILDDVEYQLPMNNGIHHLHGGYLGFHRKLWKPFVISDNIVSFTCLSADGEMGYPGDVMANVTYSLISGENGSVKLVLDYNAMATRSTPLNMTNHSYFNLGGRDAGREALLQHQIQIFADRITESKADLTPTGKIIPVAGTPFDFREMKPLTADLLSKVDGGGQPGFDQNFCINDVGEGDNFTTLRSAAYVQHPDSGRFLKVFTTLPGVQFYTGNFLPQTQDDADEIFGKFYGQHSGFCLETQFYPDSPNQPHFPSTILKPGTAYRSRTEFEVGILQQ
ncbi:unnamed protein product [Cyprideis torosa]|uniref:Aldose 1-epimerase n=1 Tax=Cyprideis torosa TaxID=163714 RepID=A0A7R8W6A6_9CRUS|nr:unnamed protein product [Cyprideis torosa]CAG0886287.1 unnamed protein product [Cyprideis torosa]